MFIGIPLKGITGQLQFIVSKKFVILAYRLMG